MLRNDRVPKRRRGALCRARRATAAITLVLFGLGYAEADNFNVRNGTVAGGGSVESAGSFRVISTLGEPVMGTTSAGEYRLTAGFPATLPDAVPPSGDIFSDGFE